MNRVLSLAVALHPRISLSISFAPWLKIVVSIGLLLIAATAAVGADIAPQRLKPPFLTVIPVAGYIGLRFARSRWWLEGTVIYRQRAFRAQRLDLSHANVEPGKIVNGRILTAVKVFDPIHSRRMTLPLVTATGATLPVEEIQALHAAILAGQRWRQKKALEKGTLVLSYLEALT